MKTSFIFGTRPEAIKLAPVALKAKEDSRIHVEICVTAQHREMLDQALNVFDLIPDYDLNLMKHNQTLADFSSNALKELNEYLRKSSPDIVFVQGDTSTAFIAALAAYYNKIKVAHVEAGLRTHSKYSPFPEEINRTLISPLADLHFAPTKSSFENLIKEGVPQEKIFITGNTVIDALLFTKRKAEKEKINIDGLPNELLYNSDAKVILITGHRRENFGDSFNSICLAIKELAEKHQDIFFIYPVHLNPNVQEPVLKILSHRKNILLIKPLGYRPFVALMNRAHIILTDSGGIQEEAPSLGKPVLVMRDTTERPDAILAGSAKLVGPIKENIIASVEELLTNHELYHKMSSVKNPYGDGNASERIIHTILSNK